MSALDCGKPKIEIRNAYGGAILIFEVCELTDEGTVFRCTLNDEPFHGAVDANTYLVGPPSSLFVDIAREWRGWAGTKTWEDMDHALALKASNEGGRVTLHVQMRFDQPPALTSLASSLFLESAALDGIARDAVSLFREDQSREFLKRLGEAQR